jgi:dihydrofolate synthase/folylpolyglutamate synthase
MRSGIPVIFGSPHLPLSISSEAQRRRADLRVAGRDFSGVRVGDEWQWSGRGRKLQGLTLPALHGEFQLQNAAAALAMLEALDKHELLHKTVVNSAMTRLSLPGRLQGIDSGRHWLLDVAHNPDAARVLGETLSNSPSRGRTIGVLGVLADKDLESMLQSLCPVVDEWIAVPAKNARSLAPDRLAARIANCCNKPCRISDDIGAGLRLAESLSTTDDTILITGSFYTVGPALDILDPAG